MFRENTPTKDSLPQTKETQMTRTNVNVGFVLRHVTPNQLSPPTPNPPRVIPNPPLPTSLYIILPNKLEMRIQNPKQMASPNFCCLLLLLAAAAALSSSGKFQLLFDFYFFSKIEKTGRCSFMGFNLAGRDGGIVVMVEGERSVAEVTVDDYPGPGANPGHQPTPSHPISGSADEVDSKKKPIRPKPARHSR